MDADRPSEHRRYEEMAVAHVLGGLDEAEGRLFRNHLVGCPDCRARVGELRALAHDLADVERDERRVRAARALETKRRETGEDDRDPELVNRPFRPRLMTVLSISAILALSAWNFTLRGTVDRVARDIERSVEAAATLGYGTAATVLRQAEGVRGLAKVQDGALVLLVDGLKDGLVYALYLEDAKGVVFRAPLAPKNGRVFSLIDFPDGAERLILVLPEGAPSATPEGTRVFEADVTMPQELE